MASKSNDALTRVQDYLDDKFQTLADLENVDELLLRVQEQQQLLQKQLSEAETALATANENAQQHAKALENEARRFKSEQETLDRQLKSITGSRVSDEAVQKFEHSMSKLQRVEIAQGYLELLQQVDRLIIDTKNKQKNDPRTALASYRRLRSLTDGLQEAQPAAEGAAPHLIDHVETQTKAAYDDLRASLVKDFQATLEKMKWPNQKLNLTPDVVSTWSEQAELLLELQEPALLMNQAEQISERPIDPIVLLPVEVLVQPLATRFRFHFYGSKPTNRLDKPSYYFTYVLDLLDQQRSFLTEILQPVLDAQIDKKDELERVMPDAISAYITGLLPMVFNKCLSALKDISSQPQLLSNFIKQVMSFDATLRESWGYTPVPGIFTEWKGLTWSILTRDGLFETWLGFEKEFALNRYKTIRDAPESGDIDYDGVEPSQTKPTKGTIRVNDLLETITDRYKPLVSFSQKMKFLMEIQLFVFDDYHHFLHSSFQAYLSSSHTAGRLLQGRSKAEAFGEKSLASLAKIFGSAEFLERKMSDWSEDIFFLELWEELQYRAQTNSGTHASLGRDLSVEEVAAKTSSSIRRQDGSDPIDTEGGALFDEAQHSYRRLREQAEAEIIRLLDTNIKDAARPYILVESWASLSSTTTDSLALSPSPALDSLLEMIVSLLGFLSKVFAPAPLYRVTKHFCFTLQKQIYDNVIMKHSFSEGGALQLRRDVVALGSAIDGVTSTRGVGLSDMRHLSQVVTLLSLPMKTSAGPMKDDDDNDWGFDNDDTNENDQADSEIENLPTPMDNDSAPGLWQVKKILYQSNESARQILSELGLDLLSETDARNIVSLRI